MHKAVRENNTAQVENLLKGGASINCLFYGWTPLILAVKKGHTDLALMFIDKGCDIHYKDEQGTSAFQEAVTKNNLKVVESLIQHGVDVNQILLSRQPGLCEAAENDSKDLAKVLIEGKANPSLSNHTGESPLHICAREGHSGIARQLLDAGVDVNLLTEDTERLTPLMVAVQNDQEKVANILLKSKCNVNIQDCSGQTALWYAVTNSNETLVQRLLSAGADVTMEDNAGRTVIDEARDNEDEDVLELLKKGR